MPMRFGSARHERECVTNRKKKDVAKHAEVFDHVDSIFNEPPRHKRVAPHLAIRRRYHKYSTMPFVKSRRTMLHMILLLEVRRTRGHCHEFEIRQARWLFRCSCLTERSRLE